MATHKIKSYAKINLALNIVGKTSSLHKIEDAIDGNAGTIITN